MRLNFLLATLWSCAAVFGPTASGQTLGKEQMESDLTVLAGALREAHGGFNRFLSSTEAESAFERCKLRFPETATPMEFAGMLSEMLAEFRDGHMRLEFDEQTTNALNAAPLLPVKVLLENDHVMIAYNDTPDDQSLVPGVQLLSINGHDLSGLLTTLRKKLSPDGFMETGRTRTIERVLPIMYYLYVDRASSFDIEARDRNGKTIKARLAGVSNADREANRKKNPVNAPFLKKYTIPGLQATNIEIEFLKQNSVAWLRVRGFGGDDFKRKIDSCMQLTLAKGSQGFILDLRGNGGGVDEYGAFLVSRFMSKPFRYFNRINLRTINPTFTTWKSETYTEVKNGTVPDGKSGFLVTPALHSGVGEQQAADKPFSGSLVVLTNGATFSTAADVCAILRTTGRAKFVGEETGGGYEGNTSGLNARVVLPNSGFRLRVQMYEYWNEVSAPAQRGRGILPDYPVANTIVDLLEGKDAQRKKALEILQR